MRQTQVPRWCHSRPPLINCTPAPLDLILFVSTACPSPVNFRGSICGAGRSHLAQRRLLSSLCPVPTSQPPLHLCYSALPTLGPCKLGALLGRVPQVTCMRGPAQRCPRARRLSCCRPQPPCTCSQQGRRYAPHGGKQQRARVHSHRPPQAWPLSRWRSRAHGRMV